MSTTIHPLTSKADLFRPPLLADPVPLGRPSLLWLQPGVTRAFGIEDIGASGLVSGFAAVESGHIWNDGIDATLRLATRKAEQPMELELLAEPYVTRQNPSQDVTIFANGARAGFWRLDHREVTRLTAWLDPRWWRVQEGGSTLRVVVHLPQSASPSELGDGEDVRRLALSFRSLTLIPVLE